MNFEGSICGSLGGEACSDSAFIPQTYGDGNGFFFFFKFFFSSISSTEPWCDVIWKGGGVTRGVVDEDTNNFRFWTGCGTLTSTAWGGSGALDVSQILFNGTNIRLDSFQLSGCLASLTITVTVIDAFDGAVLFQQDVAASSAGPAITVTGPWSSVSGLALQLGDLYNGLIDNVVYSENSSAPVTTASTSMSTTTTATTLMSTTAPTGTQLGLLTFEGNICNGGLLCADVGNNLIDQSYGDTPYLDVRYSAGLSSASRGVIQPGEGTGFTFWNTGYGGLEKVAFGVSSGTLQQIHFVGSLTLNSFQLAAYSSGGGSCTYSIIDAANNTLLFEETVATPGTGSVTISGPWSSSSAYGLAIQLQDLYLNAIDNVDFIIYTNVSIINTTGIPRDELLTFSGDICEGGFSCFNGDYIDQSYGDSEYCDVQYSADISESVAARGLFYSF